MAAKLVDKKLHNVPGKLRVAELLFDVPVNYNRPDDGTLRLFARSVRRLTTSFETPKEDKQLPWLVYLQGGPGYGCRPPLENGWIGTALDKGYQVLFLDQRGTGLSSTITASTLALKGNAIKQAEYLKNFRADNIVKDCEAVRRCLTVDYPEDKRKWSIIGQSFGGFCAVTYLSMFPEGLAEAFICGGLPPLVNDPDSVYARTYEKLEERNKAYYSKFPEDVERVKRIIQYLKENDVSVPSGKLTPARFQQLGLIFGMHGGLDSIHELVLRAWNDLEIFGFLTHPTRTSLDAAGGFDSAVIYAILHEAIYCQGQASNWSADRLRSANSNFSIDANRPEIWFTGEMIYKDMFDSYDELNEIKETADILATTKDWPPLYDEAQLAKNEVPVYAATYIDDMYVHFSHASNTAAKIKGIKQFITNTMYHNALRAKSDEVMQQLFALRDDTID
ncbi:Alpha/Beta hydrolase protein [Aspergillus caelatus]|uniref:Alpha/Beta hydrolase protein n=2 Tax=Aspergillus subgen. Circumdati TaxID=2720871 RepID=A0A5N7AES6_9EURO|nr:Alpha/Beta hydrolase protein [Aspergillus caelatus]KAE8367818.1 Alpha/Beta hydrolase protein [Aspergillus caelatus]KAE8421683.1 Alpha/Beta hydrolase protein [Aspergillus pseudocaelatus]